LGAWREFVESGLRVDKVSVENESEDARDGDGDGDGKQDEEPMIHIETKK